MLLYVITGGIYALPFCFTFFILLFFYVLSKFTIFILPFIYGFVCHECLTVYQIP